MSSGGVMLSGWLRKSPPENKLKSRHHSWKKRWFVLKSGRMSGDPNVLEYSKYQTSKRPIKTINLNDCMQIDVNVNIHVKGDKKDNSEHFIFSIVTNSRTFYLVADSSREMSTWVQCLCDLCGFNHDTTDKGELGRHEQTFRAAQQGSLNAVGSTIGSSPLLRASGEVPPTPAPRPDKTLPSHRTTESSTRSVLNGTVNTSFTHPSHNGYDVHAEGVGYESGIGITIESEQRDFYHERADAALMLPDLPVLTSVDETSGYLHLTECESVPTEPGFLTLDKADIRRCSTDSVFTHGDGTDDSKDDDSLLAPPIQPKSRFLDPSNSRLDSMPSVPPPPPPTDVAPNLGDDDDDDVVDARRKPTLPRNNRLPPIDDSGLYNVPPGLQRQKQFSEEHYQGSNSSSSYGSCYGMDRRSSGKISSPPDYINTQDERNAEQLPGSSLSSPSPSSANSASLGHQIYDIPSPMSPVFPLSASPRPNYQVPQSLERTILARNAPATIQIKSYQENTNSNDFKMLDVRLLSSISDESSNTDADNLSVTKLDVNGAGMNSDSTYAVPPTRPPKPVVPSIGQVHVSEDLYSSPRIVDGGCVDQKTYDTVRNLPLLSTPDSCLDSQSNLSESRLFPHGYSDRNAISATNSPLATPDMERRNNANMKPSLKSNLLHFASLDKGVSGSAPSIYDMPQPLSKSPVYKPACEMRSSVNSSTSGDGSSVNSSSTRNSAIEGNSIYDMPRKSSDTSLRPKLESFDKVDDIIHPSYEKMAAQPDFKTDVHHDTSYTAMAGVMSTPDINRLISQVPPVHTLHSRLMDDFPHEIPPPVNRDLKPGRRSLGSDGGSSQSGMDRRKNNSRDSYESDEAVSPPHTSLVPVIPVFGESRSFHYGHSSPSVGTRSGLVTSPQHNKLVPDFHTNVSPTPPQRPPKSSSSIPSPRSPPSTTLPSQLQNRPYTPTHMTHKSPQIGQSLTTPVPERPPKPPNMRFNHVPKISRTDSRLPPKRPPKSTEDPNFVPSRPPKPSMTPSTGDSQHSASSLHPTFFPHNPSSYSPSSIVPPPPMEHIEKELKYIEISTHNTAPACTSESIHDRNSSHELVEYTELDVDRTRALEKMKKERQNDLQQRANSDTQSSSKSRD